jgi:hypothetical protein
LQKDGSAPVPISGLDLAAARHPHRLASSAARAANLRLPSSSPRSNHRLRWIAPSRSLHTAHYIHGRLLRSRRRESSGSSPPLPHRLPSRILARSLPLSSLNLPNGSLATSPVGPWTAAVCSLTRVAECSIVSHAHTSSLAVEDVVTAACH